MAGNVTALDADAAAWDGFIENAARGQFQQATGWAHVKALDGWFAHREYLKPPDPASGGFQLLWKRAGLARIGYVSKGPVLPEESAAELDAALERILAAARRLDLAAVVVQPPDDSRLSPQRLSRHGCFGEPLASVIRTTGIVDLNGGPEGVTARMSRTARQAWRSAARRGVTLRWGTRDDVPRFFHLMEATCRRQHTRPNPGRLELLQAIWTAFPGRILLALSEHEDDARAGVLMIRQGRTIVFWKKGWDSGNPRLPVNEFLMAECLVWATANGYATADMAGMSPDVAAAFVSESGLDDRQQRSRDVFNLRLGARPKLLPPAQLWVVNPAMRPVVHAALRWPLLRRLLERRIG